MKKYIAKSDKKKINTASIEEHTNKLLELFDYFKNKYKKIIRLIKN